MLDTKCRKYVQPVIKLGANLFMKIGFSANDVTVLALVLGLLSGVFIYLKMPIASLILLWGSGYLDAVDGSIARVKGSTLFGTVMDVTFDRVVEISLILGIAFRYPDQQLNLIILTCSIIISMTVFLTTGVMSDKISEKSFYYQTGLAERTEGFVMFSLMIVFSQYLSIFIITFYLMIFFTAGQRFLEAKRILNVENARK